MRRTPSICRLTRRLRRRCSCTSRSRTATDGRLSCPASTNRSTSRRHRFLRQPLPNPRPDLSRAHRQPQLVLALVCLPVFIGALDLTIVSAVLPDVISSLKIDILKLDVAGWVVTGYFVSYAVSMTFMGKVSDIAGRRFVYLVCLVIFFIGSWFVAASPGWPARFTLRAMQLF